MQQSDLIDEIRRRSRIARGIILLIITFFVIFFCVMRSIINDGATYAQPDAVFYENDGRVVMATVITYESGATVSYEADEKYAEGIDLESGKRLWRVDLDAKNSRDQDDGEAALLGQSAKYLFFWRNELYVIDKQTGKVIAQNDHFEDLKSKMSREPLSTYYNHDSYIYNDSLQAVLIKGNDGLFYNIDGNTLKPAIINNDASAQYFKDRPEPRYNNLVIPAYHTDKYTLALLDNQELASLQNNNFMEGALSKLSKPSVRKALYSYDGKWRNINSAVYINGGFLVNPLRHYQQPADSLADNPTFKQLAGNNGYAPISLKNGGLLLAHKTSTENTAAILLTALQPDGKKLWEMSTNLADINLVYQHPDKHQLYLMGQPAGKYDHRMKKMLCIDLSNGSITTYEVK
ncbi:MAG: PA2928 family protein [Bacteroidota bacterium]